MKQTIAQFVDECLDGNWQELAHVNSSASYDPTRPLANSDMLRCPGRKFDCDDSNLARAVYHEVWGLDAPQFRGDTMNSFRTAFGQELISHDVVDNPRVFDGTESKRWPELPECLRERIGKFYSTYHTIGNFLPLPNAKIDGVSLNQYRGTCKWHDYFAPFLAAVKDYLEGHSEKLPPKFVKLMDANDFFWNDYKGNFERYVDDFFLGDYLDEEGYVIDMPALYYWDKSLSEGEYIYRATHYLDFAEMVIRNRAEKMIDELGYRRWDFDNGK